MFSEELHSAKRISVINMDIWYSGVKEHWSREWGKNQD